MRLRPVLPPQGSDPTPDHIAGLVLRLEEDFAPSLTLTTWAVRGLAGVEAKVVAHLHDGSRHIFTASDARLVAFALRDAAGKVAQLHAWADSLNDAADAAELQASAMLLGRDTGRDTNGLPRSSCHPYWRGV